ncbi:MAG: redoxin domain-containing protein [Sphingobacteriales bacterium]|nr:MAG: redoxin domain-containing protein [Sphingobacteriales bacterium]
MASAYCSGSPWLFLSPSPMHPDMKTGLKYSVVIAVLLLIGYFLSRTVSAVSSTNELKTKRQTVPDFSQLAIQMPSKTVPKTMLKGRTNVIILFNPDCEHCQYEAAEISKNGDAFKQADVWMLTTEKPARVRAFTKQFGLDTLANVCVGILTPDELYKTFGPTAVPHLFIYGPDGNLRKEYKGETKLEAILKYL